MAYHRECREGSFLYNQREKLQYESANGTDLDFEKAESALAKVILNGQAVTQDYIAYGILHRACAKKDREFALRYFRRAITEGNSTRNLQ